MLYVVVSYVINNSSVALWQNGYHASMPGKRSRFRFLGWEKYVYDVEFVFFGCVFMWPAIKGFPSAGLWRICRTLDASSEYVFFLYNDFISILYSLVKSLRCYRKDVREQVPNPNVRYWLKFVRARSGTWAAVSRSLIQCETGM